MIPCLYHKSFPITRVIAHTMSILRVHVCTMSQCLHQSPWFHIYTMNPYLYHESFSIIIVIFHTISQDILIPNYDNNKINTNYRDFIFFLFFFLQKYSFKKCGNTNNRNTETEIPQYKLQKNRNISYRNTN